MTDSPRSPAETLGGFIADGGASSALQARAALDALLAENERLRTRNELLESVLGNIANGYWNAGRDDELTLREYADSALSVAALREEKPQP